MMTIVGKRAAQVIWLTTLVKGGGSRSHNKMLAEVAEAAMNDGL